MRKTRQLYPDVKYHVIARANRKELILNSPEIKKLFIEIINRAKKKYQFTLTNFCIMGNHVHLMIKPSKNENLSRIMQWILATFAINYNKKLNLVGHVWYDRFFSSAILSFRQYLKTFEYIAENPVKAKIVKDAKSYKYGGIWYLKKGIYKFLEPPESLLIAQFPVYFGDGGLY